MFGKKKEKDEEYYKTHMTEEELAKKYEEKHQEELLKRQKGKVAYYVEKAMESAGSADRIRKLRYPRWMKICGVDSAEQIDWNNPYVKLESFLCDPSLQRELIQGRRDNVLAQMDEQMRQTYLTCTVPFEGTHYTDIERTDLKKAVKDGKKLYKRELKGKSEI